MPDSVAGDYILGIDLGTNSVGWAIVGLVDGEPSKLIRSGVRVFDAGMEGNIESGREESRNKARRDARLHRRQLWRHKRRIVKVAHVLQRMGLLPEGNVSAPESRQDFFNRLDVEFLASGWLAVKEKSGLYPEPRQVLPYILRAAALDERLEPHQLGRALYHLAQRRGFLSNRKAAPKKDEKPGEVKEGISKLLDAMKAAGARTLGEYFARHGSPSEERIRGPQRWTSRAKMYEPEFEQIWRAQAAHHPDILTPERYKELRRAIFYQRPLWFDPDTIGKCELEPGQRRAPAHLLVSQRFRLLQKVNDLQIEKPGELPRYLTPEERAKLSDDLELEGDLSFHKDRKVNGRIVPSVRKLLGLPKEVSFNLQRGGEGKIPGNRTTSKFYAVFGGRWLEMSAEEHSQAIQDVLSIQNHEALKRRALKHWNLDERAADEFSEISLEPDYASLSRRAMDRLLPLLEQGVAYSTARKEIYPASFESHVPLPLLPSIAVGSDRKKFKKWLERKGLLLPDGRLPDCLAEIRNPAVMRSLTELRKVVNAIVRDYGKPTHVRIELARDLKKPKWLREEISKKNRENEKSREGARERYKQATGDSYPSRDDLRKPQLFDECHGNCVYCGTPMSGRSLFGKESAVDIDHIIPFSRSMDDSFINVLLCHSECNRAKGNKTPYEAYSGDSDNYERILERVGQFAGDRNAIREKLTRFKMDEEELQKFLDDFRKRQLNDTAYAAALASKYLGMLFGGVKDDSGIRVQASSGQSTYNLRKLWKLNAILNDGPTSDAGRIPKSRTDHRHHAVDAVVIALTDEGMIKRLSDAAQRAPLEHHRRFASLQAPWPNFVDSVRTEINRITVSHRVSKKVSGPLHADTIYSPPGSEQNGLPPRVRRVVDPRLPGKGLSKKEVKDIADNRVKQIIIEKLKAAGTDEPKVAFAKPANLPFLPSNTGSPVPIKRVAINVATPVRSVGQGARARFVSTDNNHHVEIIATLGDREDEIDWDGRVVPMLDAFKRLKERGAIIEKTVKESERYKFSLCPGEMIECDSNAGGRRLLIFKGVSQFTAGPVVTSLLPVNDASKNPKLIRVVPNTLKRWHSVKVAVSPLGQISEAND